MYCPYNEGRVKYTYYNVSLYLDYLGEEGYKAGEYFISLCIEIVHDLVFCSLYAVTIAHTVRYIDILFKWAQTKVMYFDQSYWLAFQNATKDLYKKLKRHDRKVKVRNGDYDTGVLQKRKEWPEGGLLQLQECVRTNAKPIIEKVSTTCQY